MAKRSCRSGPSVLGQFNEVELLDRPTYGVVANTGAIKFMNLNFVTTFALLLWPAIALWLYKTRPVGQATLWTILGAYLILPVGANVKFAMIPQLDKSSIPNILAFFSCVIILRKRIRISEGFGLPESFMLALLAGPFITRDLNGDDVVIGGQVR